MSYHRGERHGRSKLSNVDVLYIRDNPHLSLRKLAVELHVHHSTIERVRNRHTWGHLSRG